MVRKLIVLVITFLLKFRIVYNIPNRVVVVLLRFFKYFVLLVGNSFNIPNIKSEIYFPQSIPGCYNYLNLDSNPFKQYVVCPTCHLLYDQKVQALITRTGTSSQSVLCNFVEFPEHPQHRFRHPCNTALLNW